MKKNRARIYNFLCSAKFSLTFVHVQFSIIFSKERSHSAICHLQIITVITINGRAIFTKASSPQLRARARSFFSLVSRTARWKGGKSERAEVLLNLADKSECRRLLCLPLSLLLDDEKEGSIRDCIVHCFVLALIFFHLFVPDATRRDHSVDIYFAKIILRQ